jgi:hypothetical protein
MREDSETDTNTLGEFLAPAMHTKVDYMHAQQIMRQRIPGSSS